MKRLLMKINSVVVVTVCITTMGCANIASNNVASEEKTYGKQEASKRQESTQSSQSRSTTPSGQSQSQTAMHASGKTVDCATLADERRNIYFKSPGDPNEKLTTVKVGATGYGAPPKNYYPEGQRRLMTMRASKIDAYRALAEIVGGLHVWGGSAIGDMVIERDRYRVFIDSFVRGAHVVSVDAMEDNTYKTIVEMEVDQRFLNHVMTFINPATDRYCYEQEADGSMKYFGYSVAPSFYYSE
ncbi:LPP20 family lipoprotein [Kaarinaea lacus]